MRPLSHPAMQDVTVEGILYALADPVRVQIFADMVNSECPQKCCHFLKMDNRALPKSTLSQHFKVLRESGLIRSERKGVEMHSVSRCAELHDRFGTMIAAIIEAYAQGKKKKTARRHGKDRILLSPENSRNFHLR